MIRHNRERRSFVVRCDGIPHKTVHLSPGFVGPFMNRLARRYPLVTWSIGDRVPLYGSD